MKFIRQAMCLFVSCFALSAFAGTGLGTITDITVLENGDVAFATSEHASQPRCATQNQWILSHDNQQTYGALLVAALQNAQVIVHGTGSCAKNGESETVSSFSFENNPTSWVNSHTALTSALSDTQPSSLNQLMETLVKTFGLEKQRTYPNVSESQMDCNLTEVESQLVKSGMFVNINVPRTHTGDVTFSMKIGKNKDFVIHYVHDEASMAMIVNIVKSPVGDDMVWKVIEDGMSVCMKG